MAGSAALTCTLACPFDTETMELVFSDTIEYSAETNAELRSLAISPDGSSIVAGDWAGVRPLLPTR